MANTAGGVRTYKQGSSTFRNDRKEVETGIARFELHNRYRFKQVFVVSGSGSIHRHKHNT